MARTGLGRPVGGAGVEGDPGRATGSTRIAWAESLLLILASNFPDADLVLGFAGAETYLLWHRGLTHSIAGLLIFPPALAVLAHAAFPRLAFRRALLLCEVGFLAHVALDLLTSWGTLVLYPWSNHRFALDWLFIMDPVLWALAGAGILLGVRRGERARRRAAAGALLAAGLYVLAAGALHRAGLENAAVFLEQEQRGDLELFPRPPGPLRWQGVAWTGDSLVHLRLAGVPPRVVGVRREPHFLAAEPVREALLTPPGQAFLWWARVPAGRILRSERDRTVVALVDRHYAVRDVNLFEMEIAVERGGAFGGAIWQGDSVFGR